MKETINFDIFSIDNCKNFGNSKIQVIKQVDDQYFYHEISNFDIIYNAFVRLLGVGFCAANPPTPAANPTPDADIA